MQSSCSPAGNGPRALAAASHQIEIWSFQLTLQERSLENYSAGQQTTCKTMADALLQVLEPVGKDLVLPPSTSSWLLEQNTCLQHVLEDLERQRSALEALQKHARRLRGSSRKMLNYLPSLSS